MTSDPLKLVYDTLSPSQYMHVYRGSGETRDNDKMRVIFFLHGGFWKSKYGIDPPSQSACDGVLPVFRSCSEWVVYIEYRRQPEDDPQSGHPYASDDCLRAYQTFMESEYMRGSDVKAIVLGHSAGGTLALVLAHRLHKANYSLPPRHTISLAPVANLRMAAELRLSDKGNAVQLYAHGEPGDMDANNESAYKTGCPTAIAEHLGHIPLTLALGMDDTDIPLGVVQSCYDAITSKCKKLLLLDNTDHYSIVDGVSPGWKVVEAEMRNHLG